MTQTTTKPINVTYLFQTDADDLFRGTTQPRRTGQRAHITCRVCGQMATIPIDAGGLLCDECRQDLDTTAQHIATVRAAVDKRHQEAWAIFEAQLRRTDAATQARWAKVEAARCDAVESAEALARFQAAWVQRKAEGGPFAQLLCAYEQLETACEQITRQLEWAQRAEDELRAAREETP